LMSGKIGKIIKWSNKDYLALVYKAYPQFTEEQIDNFSFKEKSRLRKDIFWLLIELIAVGVVTGSFCYLYKKDKKR